MTEPLVFSHHAKQEIVEQNILNPNPENENIIVKEI